jgi:hypothetical protein
MEHKTELRVQGIKLGQWHTNTFTPETLLSLGIREQKRRQSLGFRDGVWEEFSRTGVTYPGFGPLSERRQLYHNINHFEHLYYN